MSHWFHIQDSPIQGKGAFASVLIPKGTRITEYVGELITHDQANERYDDEKMERHHTFLFAVDEEHVIDGAVGGNDSIYLNHSCEPNCDSEVDGKQVYIYAMRDIAKGEELFYDYAYERDEGDDETTEKMYTCLCGTPSCRGSILAPKE